MAKKKLTLEDMLVPKDEIPYEVPENWCWTRLENLGKWSSGGTPKSTIKEYYDGEIPWLIIADLNDSYVNESKKTITQLGLDNSSAKIIPKDSVLVAMYGSIGKLGINTISCACNQAIAYMRESYNIVNNKYLFYYLLSQREYLNSLGKGGTQQNISLTVLNKVEIPIPPLAEQERIVSRIESLFDKVDRAAELVDEARDGFEKRRAAILEMAFSGELTKKWREENKNLKPTQVIVEEIKSELIKWYESKVKESKELGTKKPRKIKFDIEKSEKEYLFENIPRDWRISYFEELVAPIENSLKAGPFGSALKKDFYTEKGYKIYGQEQVIKGDPYYGDYYINEEKFKELSTCEVFEGDLLISLVGTIGKVLIIPSDYEKGIINPRLVKISLNKKVSTEYIAKYFESPTAKFIMSEKSHGGTMDILNLNIIKKLPIPLPPYEEQVEIVRLVNKMIEEELEVQEYTDISNYIDIIKKSILAKAFRGELGSNNLKEESSIELLKELIK